MQVIDSGFAVVEDVFDRSEMRHVTSLIDRELSMRSRAGARHLLGLPLVRDLANDTRLMGLAAATLGPAAIPFRATLFDKTPTANWLVTWHQDTALPLRRRVEREGWGPWSVKAGVDCAHPPASALEQIVALRVHLDDSTAENGPLRILPWTHNRGVLTDEQIARLSEQVRSIECLAPAGGVVVMRPLAVHASSKSRNARPRRVLHIEYASTLLLDRELELAVC